MLKILSAFLFIFLFAFQAIALTEKEFQSLLQASPEFREADQNLNKTWKSVNAHLNKSDKQTLLKMQREWVKKGRDEVAEEYMEMGYSKDCAYAKATRRWTKGLEVFEYNANLSQDALERGAIKADDAFWDEDDDEIPPHCRAE